MEVVSNRSGMVSLLGNDRQSLWLVPLSPFAPKPLCFYLGGWFGSLINTGIMGIIGSTPILIAPLEPRLLNRRG